MNAELLSEIRSLEEALHKAEVRRSRSAVEALLAEGFVEFGSSGKVYDRRATIDLLVQETSDDDSLLLAYDYALRALADDTVLLTYRTRRTSSDGRQRYALRSSIWQRSETGWQILFHQGTVSSGGTS